MPNPRMHAAAYCSKSLPWTGFSLAIGRSQVSSFQQFFLGPQNVPHLCPSLFLILRRPVHDTGIFYDICVFCKCRDTYVFMSFYMSCAENASHLSIGTVIICSSFWGVFSSLASLLSPSYCKQLAMKIQSL